MPERNSTAGLLAGRKVLVTGAARGLGLAFAKSIAEAGGAVALADILGERVQERAELVYQFDRERNTYWRTDESGQRVSG